MATLVCPICKKAFDAERSSALPFCSPRCREIDLGRWLDEKYTVPTLSAEPAEADASPAPPKASETDSESE